MNCKRLVIAGLATFVCFEIMDFLIHSVLLMSTYEKMMHVWRADMMDKMWIMYVLTFIFSFIFVYVFIKGYEGKGIMEGVRFGVVMGLLIGVMGLNQYVVYPIPYKLALTWFVLGIVEFIVCGMVAAAIYKPKSS